MNGRVSIRTFIFLTVVAAVAGAALAIRFPHDPYVRYQAFDDTIFHKLKWVYERLAFDEKPIDVLVVGASRSGRGINTAELEKALAARGIEVGIANVSVPAAGFDERLTIIREALTHHENVKLIIWGVVEAFPRDGHQIFANLAQPGEVFSSPFIVNRNLPGNLARLPYRQMEYWLATMLPEAFGYQLEFDEDNYLGSDPDHRLFNNPDWDPAAEREKVGTQEHADALAAESKWRRRSITPPILPESLMDVEFGASRSYVRELMQLSHDMGFDVAFLFLPFYDGYDAPLEEAWLVRYGPVWKANFLMDDPRNYVDAGHASVIGAPKLISWLSELITPYFSGQSNESATN
ncbi:hypothetical protein [Roseibium album]|uniref:hypothetical protein n=1 Tax=Roseibium album TaxID=311410 RepID=UPI002490EF73|nr:hypothetical protein [Roseibium album]